MNTDKHKMNIDSKILLSRLGLDGIEGLEELQFLGMTLAAIGVHVVATL